LELTSEGKEVAKNGSHEVVLYNAVPEIGADQAKLIQDIPNGKVGFSKAMSNGWILIDKSSGTDLHDL